MNGIRSSENNLGLRQRHRRNITPEVNSLGGAQGNGSNIARTLSTSASGSSAAATEAVAEVGKTLADIPKDQLDYISSFLSHDSNKLFKPISKTFRAANSATHLTVKPHTHMLDYKLPYYKTLSMIKTLTLKGCDVENIDFTLFTQLEEIYLSGAKNLALAQISQLPTTLKILDLSDCDISGINFTHVTQLESIKILDLKGSNVANINFTRFTQLEEINLWNTKNQTPNQISQLPPTLKKIDLKFCNIADVDFSRFRQLEEII